MHTPSPPDDFPLKLLAIKELLRAHFEQRLTLDRALLGAAQHELVELEDWEPAIEALPFKAYAPLAPAAVPVRFFADLVSACAYTTEIGQATKVVDLRTGAWWETVARRFKTYWVWMGPIPMGATDVAIDGAYKLAETAALDLARELELGGGRLLCVSPRWDGSRGVDFVAVKPDTGVYIKATSDSLELAVASAREVLKRLVNQAGVL